MEPTAKRGFAVNGRAQGMKWPLLGSAAGHLFLLSLLLLMGVAAGPGAGGVVEVILVEGAPFAPRGDVESPAGASVGARRHRAIPPGVVKAPPGPHSAAADPPALPSLASVAPSPTSPPAAAPDRTVPSSAVTPAPASGAASLSPGAAILPSIRVGGGAAPAGARAGAEHSGAGEGAGGITGNLSGAGAGGASGGPHAAARPAPGASGPGTGGGGAGRVGPGSGLLREKIQAKIVYPEEAIRRGQEGEVLLRIRIGTGGSPGEIRVAKSSGARILDEAARRGVIRAAPLPSAPGWVEVPVRFSLRPAGERP